MEKIPADVSFITNDTERSFVYENEGKRINLSALIPIKDDPAHICFAEYTDGRDEPLREIKFYKKKLLLLQKLLTDPETLHLLELS